jgi:hypothetical protein
MGVRECQKIVNSLVTTELLSEQLIETRIRLKYKKRGKELTATII